MKVHLLTIQEKLDVIRKAKELYLKSDHSDCMCYCISRAYQAIHGEDILSDILRDPYRVLRKTFPEFRALKPHDSNKIFGPWWKFDGYNTIREKKFDLLIKRLEAQL